MSVIDKPHIFGSDESTKKLSDKYVAMARRGAELTRIIKDAKAELDTINSQFKSDIGPGVSLVLPNECRIPISESVSRSLEDEAGLKAHLGTRKFNMLVTTTTSYKATPTLLDMAENSGEIAAFFSEKTSMAVKYLPIKTQK